ncbi:B3/B4 domain-containing protein [Geofilum sp. OHC36d9]|uniref:B3/B4 domain-containing protein n=1 Tax=Geofilum sp. OHC36d9 TaxID=3458413 RepID=UPI004034B9F0
MMKITIDSEMRDLFPDLQIGCILADVCVTPTDGAIRDEMKRVGDSIMQRMTPELIRRHPVVEVTKNAYRRLGKDPNRYRPAAESLLRRLAQGKGLYEINNMVDILNLVSIQTGFSIGGYDADNINGPVHFGIGRPNEPYEGIGRGALNIENLPVFRDDTGAFGTSTSDSVRTMVTADTVRFLMVFPDFEASNEALDEALKMTVTLLGQLGDVNKPLVWKV